tara:strand:- start:1602 stop:1745 length:144 start_codon:yes stop_codon:yes gene_type:complete
VQKVKHVAPATAPMQMAAIAPIEPDAGVTPTSPAIAPETIPSEDGRP